MPNTEQLVGVAAVENVAEALVRRLLEPREKRLHGRAPRSKYVHQLRRDMACGRSKALVMVVSVLFADLEEGLPLEAVLPFVDELRDALTVRAKPMPYTSTKTLRALLLAEARAQGERDVLEVELQFAPDDQDLKRRFIEATARYDAANAALTSAVSRDAALIQQRYPQCAAPKSPVRRAAPTTVYA